MVATQPMRYERRDLQAGDEFDAPQVDALYLEKTKRAQYVMDPVPQIENLLDNDQAAAPRRRGRPPRQAMQEAAPQVQPQTENSDDTDGL